jgi:hypothetical protein
MRGTEQDGCPVNPQRACDEPPGTIHSGNVNIRHDNVEGSVQRNSKPPDAVCHNDPNGAPLPELFATRWPFFVRPQRQVRGRLTPVSISILDCLPEGLVKIDRDRAGREISATIVARVPGYALAVMLDVNE